jgi:hypothetical protein
LGFGVRGSGFRLAAGQPTTDKEQLTTGNQQLTT